MKCGDRWLRNLPRKEIQSLQSVLGNRIPSFELGTISKTLLENMFIRCKIPKFSLFPLSRRLFESDLLSNLASSWDS
jgi:hypothetical protein